jgi:hypothetical protein
MATVSFAKIQKAAEQRLGKAALARRLPKVKSAAAMASVMRLKSCWNTKVTGRRFAV